MSTPKQLFEKRYNQIKKEFDTKILKAKELLEKRQKSCKHNFVYHSDASGNNDTYYECSYCKIRKTHYIKL